MKEPDSLDEIFAVFSQQSDDKGITVTWSNKDSISEAKAKIKAHIKQAKEQLLEQVEAEVEKSRIDGMFTEWNGLNLMDINEFLQALQQLKEEL